MTLVMYSSYVCSIRRSSLYKCTCVMRYSLLCTTIKCGAPFKSEDVSIINGTEEDMKRQKEAMEERRLQAKQAKLAKVRQECIYLTT